ncbi:hypothetical protein FRB99_006470 [Tulasnella sp. 403]|nr:hypothetical protein FRB99_006470 [Tulasnella sp. 403]
MVIQLGAIADEGAPASGKTTLTTLLNKHLNLHHEGISVFVPLDGWHYTRAQLSTFTNAKEAFDRRGAEWTFDAEGYFDFVSKLRQPIPTADESSTGNSDVSLAITAPSFDHALKDPTPDTVTVLPSHRIVLIEGLYVFLATPRWKPAAELLDERWFVDVDFDVATARLAKRHVLTGVTEDEEQALWRAKNNDIPNGHFVIDNMMTPTRRIDSINDPTIMF